jgi:hypothetical protein
MGDNGEEKAAEYVKVITLQLIYMATGTIVVSGTFLKDVFKHPLLWSVFILIGSWLLLFISVLFGLWVFGAIASGYVTNGKADIRQNPVRKNGLVQAWTFRVGIFIFIVFLSINLFKTSYPIKNENIETSYLSKISTLRIETTGPMEIIICKQKDIRIKINPPIGE